MKCQKCGGESRDNAKFCNKCGTQLPTDEIRKQDPFQLVTRLIMENKTEELKQILDNGCYDVNTKDGNGATVLYSAIHYKNADAFKLLIRHGANVNIKTNYGITPLMVAASTGHLSFIELLIKLNANIFDKDHRGKTAVDYATERNFSHIAEYLINLSNTPIPVPAASPSTPVQNNNPTTTVIDIKQSGQTMVIPKISCKLEFIEGSSSAKILLLEKNEVTLGRDASNDIVLPEMAVSSKHAKFIKESPIKYKIIDTNSTNGIMINGQVTKEFSLNNGDIIEIRPYKIKFINC